MRKVLEWQQLMFFRDRVKPTLFAALRRNGRPMHFSHITHRRRCSEGAIVYKRCIRRLMFARAFACIEVHIFTKRLREAVQFQRRCSIRGV